MIGKIKQPANEWLADVVSNMGKLLDEGEDPSMTFEINGATFEFRLLSLPDIYERKRIDVNNDA